MRKRQRSHELVGGLLAGFLVASTAGGQVPADLAAPQDFEAHRASTTDPHFRNGDARPIPPGQTLELANLRGSGRITHLWFTIAPPTGAPLVELVLRMYWDGAEKPAV